MSVPEKTGHDVTKPHNKSIAMKKILLRKKHETHFCPVFQLSHFYTAKEIRFLK